MSACALSSTLPSHIQVELAKYEGRYDDVAREARKAIQERQAQHDREHLGERNYAEDWWLKGEHDPSRVTALSMDAPTETQFDVPVQQREAHDAAKSLDTAKKWSSKITGLMMAGMGMLAFVSRDGLGSGPNLSCTVLYLGLLHVVKVHGGLGASLNVLLDNTSGDNKNNDVIFFLAWLVLIDAVEEASFFCMQKGHTYSRIDQSFRALIGHLLACPVYTVASLIEYIHRFLSAYCCHECIELHCLWDWKAFFAPHVHERLGGFATGQFGSGMHEFVVRKNRNGEVRLFLRKSSASSSWLPDDGGYPIFKTLPVGFPKLAKAKPDSEWGRETVQSTVRSWYRHMRVAAAEHERIKYNWEARFTALPPGGDTTQLPPPLQLRWADLPRYSPVRGGFALPTVTDVMENPPINPVTGLGRTSADVARELVAYQVRTRANASPQLPAVFQADFLFLHPPSGELCLHRVVHGACIQAATASDVAFTTTEYCHVPQAGYPGFWGHFLLRENPEYEAGNRKKGTKFVRHQQMTRSEVVLYDVQVFSVARPDGAPGNAVCVSVDSLRELASKSAHPPIPAQLPQTHGGNGKAPAARPAAPPQRQAPARKRVEARAEATAGPSGGGGGSSEAEVDEQSDDGHSSKDSEEGGAANAKPAGRVGQQMEIQGCDADECEYCCTICEWEPCTITADHGHSCDVMMQDCETCEYVANRFLRMPAAAVAKRRKV